MSNGFILRQEELIPTAIETFEGIKVVIDSVLEENNLLKKSFYFFNVKNILNSLFYFKIYF